MTKEQNIIRLLDKLNEIIFDDVRNSDSALAFKVKAIRLLLKANEYQSEALFYYIQEYIK